MLKLSTLSLMTCTAYMMLVVSAVVSASLLIGAYGFEYIGGLEPCTLCLYQRIPHALVVVFALSALLMNNKINANDANSKLLYAALTVVALIYLASTALGFYHVGVELKWWESVFPCSGNLPAMQGLSSEQILAQISQASFVRCDSPSWHLFGISMAGYNTLISAGMLISLVTSLCPIGNKD